MSENVDVVVDSKDAEAKKLIRYYAACTAGAGLLSPPVLDLAAVTAVQLRMVRRLATVYGKDFDQESGRTLVATLSAALAPALVSGSVVSLAVRFLGTGVLGKIVDGATLPSLNFGVTMLVGNYYQSHFKKPGNQKANLQDLASHLATSVVG